MKRCSLSLSLSLCLSLGLGVMPCWGSGSLEKSLSPGDMCRLHGRLQLRCQARPKPGQTIKDNIYTSGPPTHRQIQTHSHTHWHIHMQTHTLTEKGHKILWPSLLLFSSSSTLTLTFSLPCPPFAQPSLSISRVSLSPLSRLPSHFLSLFLFLCLSSSTSTDCALSLCRFNLCQKAWVITSQPRLPQYAHQPHYTRIHTHTHMSALRRDSSIV